MEMLGLIAAVLVSAALTALLCFAVLESRKGGRAASLLILAGRGIGAMAVVGVALLVALYWRELDGVARAVVATVALWGGLAFVASRWGSGGRDVLVLTAWVPLFATWVLNRHNAGDSRLWGPEVMIMLAVIAGPTVAVWIARRVAKASKRRRTRGLLSGGPVS